MNKIYVYGDSHSILFSYTKDINEHWLGFNNLPVSMNRIGKEGLDIKKIPSILGNGHEKHIPSDDDIIMYSYGSNDAYKGIPEQIKKGRDEDEIINTLINSYFNVIIQNEKDYNVKSIVYGIIPNCDKYIKYKDINDQIKNIIKKLNYKLEKNCLKNNILYFNINKYITNNNGFLSDEFTDDLIHIKKSYASFVRYNLLSFLNKLNIVLITSLCKVPETSFTYSNRRSVFTHTERYEQLLKTIDSVSINIPYSYIIISEYSEFNDDEYKKLVEKCDILLNPTKSDKLDVLYFNKIKAIGELTGTRLCLSYINKNNIGFANLFKISGRYYFNEKFDYKYFNNKKNNFYKIENNINNINTSLYKISYEYFYSFYKFIINSKNNYYFSKNPIGYEIFISKYVNLNIDNTIFLENLGISGKVSVCGSYFNK